MIGPSEIIEVFNSCRSDPRSWNAAQWLKGKGVSVQAICEPDPIFAARVAISGKFFDLASPDEDAEPALIFLARDRFGPVDIAAWLSKGKRWLTWLGAGHILGEGEIYAPRLSTEGGIRVFQSPVGWLLADRRGIVILNAEVAASRLAGLGPLIAEDVEHGHSLRKMLTIPHPRILVPTLEMIAA